MFGGGLLVLHKGATLVLERVQLGRYFFREYRGDHVNALLFLPIVLALSFRSSNMRVPAASSTIQRLFLTFFERKLSTYNYCK